MAMLDSTVANLAPDSIRVDLSSTLAVVRWVATGYLVALALALPAAGWLGSRFGYGRVWAAAVAAFALASAACALAAGPMVPAGQAVIGSVAHPDELGRLFGGLGLVIAVGPAVGGVLLDAACWRWMFWINVPVAVAALFATAWCRRAQSTRGDALTGADWRCSARGLQLLLYGATESGAAGASTAAA
jgi:MFS family permease